jgi:hypothetical protein
VAEKTECVDQAYEAEIMISMQMRNEYRCYLTPPYLVFDHLYLGAFSTVHKVVDSIMSNYLAGRMPVESGYC